MQSVTDHDPVDGAFQADRPWRTLWALYQPQRRDLLLGELVYLLKASPVWVLPLVTAIRMPVFVPVFFLLAPIVAVIRWRLNARMQRYNSEFRHLHRGSTTAAVTSRPTAAGSSNCGGPSRRPGHSTL